MTYSDVHGFRDPVHDGQLWFRAVLSAFSRPGKPIRCPNPVSPPLPLLGATAAIALSLFDVETPIWLEASLRNRQVEEYFRLYSDVKLISSPEVCQFAVLSALSHMPALTTFSAGSPEYPDTSATLVIQVPNLDRGKRVVLVGPGIPDKVAIAPGGFDTAFWLQWDENCAGFPLGVDVILTDGDCIIGLPRTSKRA